MLSLHIIASICSITVHVRLDEVCVGLGVGVVGRFQGVVEWLHCRSIKGSVVIIAESVSVTSRLHYLVSFVPAFAARLIE